MSKVWYYEMMGSELGPIGSAELIDKAKRGQIQPDTRVKSGKDGKWQFAERVKGLFPPPPPPPAPVIPVASPVSTNRPRSIPLAGDDESGEGDTTYHFDGDSGQRGAGSTALEEPGEFEFFRFIGFSQAISPALHDVLIGYARTHNLTLTQVTRRALAEFLGRKDLAEPKPEGALAGAPANEPANVAIVGITASAADKPGVPMSIKPAT